MVGVQINQDFWIPKKGGCMKTREFVKAEENLKIESEKRFQRKMKRPQVEKLTLLKETKKPGSKKG